MKIFKKTSIALTIITSLSICFFTSAKFEDSVSTIPDTNSTDIKTIETQIDSVTIDKKSQLKYY